jgi:hypothetical protein
MTVQVVLLRHLFDRGSSLVFVAFVLIFMVFVFIRHLGKKDISTI